VVVDVVVVGVDVVVDVVVGEVLVLVVVVWEEEVVDVDVGRVLVLVEVIWEVVVLDVDVGIIVDDEEVCVELEEVLDEEPDPSARYPPTPTIATITIIPATKMVRAMPARFTNIGILTPLWNSI
jgi:hypothetical protein